VYYILIQPSLYLLIFLLTFEEDSNRHVTAIGKSRSSLRSSTCHHLSSPHCQHLLRHLAEWTSIDLPGLIARRGDKPFDSASPSPYLEHRMPPPSHPPLTSLPLAEGTAHGWFPTFERLERGISVTKGVTQSSKVQESLRPLSQESTRYHCQCLFRIHGSNVFESGQAKRGGPLP